MSNATATATNNGIGFVGLLTVVLIALKLMGFITVSWWVVFAAAIASFLFWIGVVVIALVMVTKL